MRERRNTHLSMASVSSSPSTDSSATTSARNSFSEKDVERLPIEDNLADGILKLPYIGRMVSSPYAIYLKISIVCLLLFSIYNIISLAIYPHEESDDFPSAGTLSTAAAVSFADKAGKHRWTISIPVNSTFPLPDIEYIHICQDAGRLSNIPPGIFPRLQRSRSTGVFRDPRYMDIAEAQSLGALPASGQIGDTCRSSMTLIIDGGEVSFGKTLMLIWLSYGLAKKEGKAFFLDDSHWAYGRYDTYFPPLPRPACSRPAASEIVSCPLQARHTVITASSAPFAFELAFPTKRHASMLEIARLGYEASFKLVGEDASYVQTRVKTLRDEATQHNQRLVGMHIRRGDLHPFQIEYSQDYLPLELFTNAAKAMLMSDSPTTLLVSSDDPDIVESPELTMLAAPHTLVRSQDRIQLATKLALDRVTPVKPVQSPNSAYTKHIDENAGWDGGFYSALFKSIGDSRKRSERHLLAASPSKETMRMKELIARGYLLDLAVLSTADGVVCAVSSAACRLLAVMMAPEAVRTKQWTNIDDGRPWSWDGQW